MPSAWRRRCSSASDRRPPTRASVVCITGDAGFGYTIMEIDTHGEVPPAGGHHRLQQQRVGHLGAGGARPRALPIHLFQENLRYDRIAEALGGHGEYVTDAVRVPAGARARL